MNMPLGLTIFNRKGALPLQGARLDARIRDLFCDVTFEQRYRNSEQRPIEAVYTFPLPLDAVLLDVQVRLGDKDLHGAVVPKAQAERKYEEAMAEGDAAIRLERIEPGLYSMNVGNLLAGEEAVIVIRYGQLLRWTGNAVRFHIPTTLAPRYGVPRMPPHQVPPVSLLAENRFTFDLRVEGLLAAAVIDCPSHRLTTRRSGEAIEFSLAGRESFMDRDLVLNFTLAGGSRSIAVSVAHGEGRVALLSWRPEIPASAGAAPRAYKILIDCSGSMNGDSIRQAGLALAGILDALRPHDVFDIVFFGNSHEALFGKLRPASRQNVDRARACAAGLQADMGGTETGRALLAAYRLKGADPEIRPDVLLVTDGQVSDIEPIIEAAAASRHRIFTVGVGAGVAEAFVRRLAAVSGGACELVSPNEDMVGRIVRHFQRIGASRATRARILWPGKPTKEAPARLDAVYDGDTCHAFAWLPVSAQGEARAQLTLEDGRQLEEAIAILPVAEDGPATAAGHPIARMAAATLLAEAGEGAQAIALEYQLLTEQTDFLVVHQRAEGEKAQDLAVLRPVAHMLAAGWGGVGSVAEPRIHLSMDYSLPSGGEAFFGEAMELGLPRRRSGLSDTDAWVEMFRSLESEIEFDSHAGRLKHCDLAMLERGDVFDELVEPLRRLVEQGLDEYQVVIGCLLVMARYVEGPQLFRESKRAIRKAAARANINEQVLVRVSRVVGVVTGRGVSVNELLEDLRLPAGG